MVLTFQYVQLSIISISISSITHHDDSQKQSEKTTYVTYYNYIMQYL